MKDLESKTAVITGAASGMGLAFARRFAQAGMKIVLADIEPARLDSAVGAVQDLGGAAIGVPTDVADADSVDALRDAALAEFGSVHLVCNNAGVAEASETLAEWQWVMGVNFWGVVNGILTFRPLLVEQDEGHFVTTASAAGLAPRFGSYAASKSAAVAVTEGLYTELRGQGSRVGVSCLCPMAVNTDIMNSDRNRPAWAHREHSRSPESEARRQRVIEGVAGGRAPEDVADYVHDAVLNDQFWIWTEPETPEFLRARFDTIVEATNPAPVRYM